MKFIKIIIGILIVFGFENSYSQGLHVSQVQYQQGIVKYKGKPYTGFINETYNNGVLKVLASYKEGKKHGVTKEYDKQGKIQLKTNFKDGKRDGVQEFYDTKGMVYKTRNYLLSVLHGPQINYYSNGKEIANGLYSANKKISGTFLNYSFIDHRDDGYEDLTDLVQTSLPGGPFNDFNFRDYKSNSENAKAAISESGDSKLNEPKDQFAIEKYEAGNMIESNVYSIDMKIVRKKQYSIVLDGNSKSTKSNGQDIIFFPNGKPHYKRFYTNGVRSGIWETYSREGMLLFTGEYRSGLPLNGKFLKTGICCRENGKVYYQYDTFENSKVIKSEEVENIL